MPAVAKKKATKTTSPPTPIKTSLVLQQLSRETLQTRVHAKLRHAIMGGLFAPGETVTLRQLAETFGTSIMPVREAITRLIGERALLMLPNRTVIVPEMTRERFADITTARVLAEQHVARLAASRMQPAQISEIEKQNDRIRSALKKNDWRTALEANRDFHFMIYRGAGSEVFTHIIETLWLQAGPFLVFSAKSPSARWTTEHHIEIVKALKSRNGSAAAKAVAADINETAKQLLQSVAFLNDASEPRVSAD